MIGKFLTVVVLVIWSVTQPVVADEDTKEWTGSEIAGMALLVEGVIGLNAYLASQNPKVYGVAGALLFPVAMSGGSGGKSSDVTRWVGLASVEALAIYNIGIDEDKMTKSEIFRNNFIGWHAAAGIMAVAGYFAGDFNRDKQLALNYVAEPRGGRFLLSYNF